MTTLVNAENSSAMSPCAKERVGVVLVNLGTPEAPTPSAVRRFLAEFLSDRRVVELPKWVWWPILHGIVLRFRPRKSAHAYAQIWTSQGSPLMVQSQALTEALRIRLQQQLGECQIRLAMTYGQPSIAEVMQSLKQPLEQQIDRLVIVPLYPQYSGTTTASVFDLVTKQLRTWRAVPSVHFVRDYYADAGYIQALAQSVREHWQQNECSHLFMSFHGVPQPCVDKGDPYMEQCQRTAQLLATELDLSASEWTMTFQSRFGRQEWIKPYTETVLKDYAKQGPKRLTVLCPGFAVDCLETLEEIALRNRAAFLTAGGEQFDYVSALNVRPSHVEALASLVLRQLGSHT
jgi:protoporphyrin/coproporphyrin ferrochelatase